MFEPNQVQINEMAERLIADMEAPAEWQEADQISADTWRRVHERVRVRVEEMSAEHDARHEATQAHVAAALDDLGRDLRNYLEARNVAPATAAEAARRFASWVDGIVAEPGTPRVATVETVMREVVPELPLWSALNIEAGPEHWLNLWAKNQAHEAAEQLSL